MTRSTPATVLALALAASVGLVGCTSSVNPADDRPRIVASTDVYASIASAVAGDLAEVVAIIDNPTQDPHSYEGTARDRLALAGADLVIENGGGYDPYIDALLDDDSTARVLVAINFSSLLVDGDGDHDGDHGHGDDSDDDSHEDDGHNHSHDAADGVNEHVWYDLETVQNLAAAILVELSDLDPANSAAFEANALEFHAAIDELRERAHELESEFGDVQVVLTEPAPQALLELVGAHNVTPAAFTNAVEAGFDVPPSAMLEVLRLVESADVDLVAWNEQTSGPQLQRVADVASEAGVAVISVTETLPAGHDYVSWMTANLDAIEAALRS